MKVKEGLVYSNTAPETAIYRMLTMLYTIVYTS